MTRIPDFDDVRAAAKRIAGHARRTPLLEVVDRRLFDKPGDWLALLPMGFEPFTATDLAHAMGIRLQLAQKMAYSLREAKLVKLIGKRGRAHLYAAGA